MKAKLGSGKRFAALKAKLARRPGIKNPGALAAAIGRKKLGSAKMAKLSAIGRHRAAMKRGEVRKASNGAVVRVHRPDYD